MLVEITMPKNKLHYNVMLLMFVVFFISDDTVTFGTNENQYFIIFKYIVYLFLLVYLLTSLFFKNVNKTFLKKDLLFIILIVLSFFFTTLINFDFRNGYLIQALIICLAAAIAKYFPINLFPFYYTRLLYFLCVSSLIVFITVALFSSVISFFPTTTNYAGVEFGNLFFCAVFKHTDKLRNTSIFREPGVFAIYILIGIIIELFYNAKINSKYLLIYIITLISTFSTSGFLVFGLVTLGYILKRKNIVIKSSMLIFLLALILIIYFLPEVNNLLLSKFNEDSADYASALARISSFSVPTMIFITHPFWGAGLTNFAGLYEVYSDQLFGVTISAEDSSTNTIINTFAIYGITYGIALLYALYKISKFFGKTFWVSICILSSMSLMFSNEEMRFSLLFNLIIMYGLFMKKRRSLKFEKDFI